MKHGWNAVLAAACAILVSCASAPMAKAPPAPPPLLRGPAQDPMAAAFDSVKEAMGTAFDSVGYTDEDTFRRELESGRASGAACDFAASQPQAETAILAVAADYGLDVKSVSHGGSGSVILADSGMLRWGLGELVGMTVWPLSAGSVRVTVVSRARFGVVGAGKDWTSDIFAGLKARLWAPVAQPPAATLPGQVPGVQPAAGKTGLPPETAPGRPASPWLDEVSSMIAKTFERADSPALVVACEGRDGDYLADRILDRIDRDGLCVRVVATGRDLDKALSEQEKSLSGVYDEATTVKVGRLVGARYAFLGTPYVKRSAGVVELSCRILDIETGLYLGSVRIVAVPLSELPD